MKALFVSIYAATPHFETELELMADLLREGHEVHVLRCTTQLESCLLNPKHRPGICLGCVSKVDRGLEHLRSPRFHVHVLEPAPIDPRLDRVFANTSELKLFELDGMNLGRGACSTVCSAIDKDVRLDTRVHAAEIRRQLRAAHQMLTATRLAIASIRPDSVYLFNGRFSSTWPIVLAAREAGVDFYTHERGSSAAHYVVRKNVLPHDIDTAQAEMATLWGGGDADKVAIGRGWFEGRRAGAENAWLSFTKTQEKGKLPDGFDTAKHNIAIFNSTMEEYDSIECWTNPLYDDEVAGLEQIARRFADRPNTRLYLRVHPNLKNIPRAQNYQLRRYAEVERATPNLTVIWPESVVHTYALMEASQVVLTFGSTMGAESTFWGKPSICAGRSLYEHLDCAYVPRSHEEVVALLGRTPEPKPTTNTVPYGYWEATKGIRYQRFQPIGLFGGAFEGEVLRPGLMPRLLEHLERVVLR